MIKQDKNKAVSEAVGYITIIGLIFLSISLAYYNGVPALQNAKEQQKIMTVQTAFETLRNNIVEVVRGESTKRGTEIRLSGGKITVGGYQTRVNVSIINSTGVDLCDLGCNTSFNPIVYERGNDKVVYEAGAIIRSSGKNQSAMVVGPRFVVENTSMILPVVATKGASSIAGDGVFAIGTTEQFSNSLIRRSSKGLNVTITVESPFYTAWKTYFGFKYGFGKVTTTPSQEQVTAKITGMKKVIYSKHIIDVVMT